MADNSFIQNLIEALLSWIRLMSNWVWDFLQADMGGGFLGWFKGHWRSLALTLIIAGVIIDWLIWMIRWRPYWLWLRKRQIIYEDVPSEKTNKGGTAAKPAGAGSDSSRIRYARRHMPKAGAPEYDDPFAVGEIDPYALTQPAARGDSRANDSNDTDWEPDWDAPDDPYAADYNGSKNEKRPTRRL